jgi:hypothetical protein
MIDRIGEITHELPVAIMTHVVMRKRQKLTSSVEGSMSACPSAPDID